ncbi:hypothetical protein [Catenovulum maritimum]|uniref:HDOD domain-containing protein n=1 Tax=Catenovulum maritimum TaxID=1513271 RepID=A0A0J8JM75_9ALTE|nr:hypothetical protein [Catenovulum maritimum]KMT65686.1 hypothetical protein XM47_08310 [Catenovulum maritimum]
MQTSEELASLQNNAASQALNLAKLHNRTCLLFLQQKLAVKAVKTKYLSIANHWIKLFQKAPIELEILFIQTQHNTSQQARYLKTNLLILLLARQKNLHLSLIKQLVYAAQIRDITNFKVLHKGGLDKPANGLIRKSSIKCIQFCAKHGLSYGLSEQLIANQYRHQSPPVIGLGEQIFNTSCEYIQLQHELDFPCDWPSRVNKLAIKCASNIKLAELTLIYQSLSEIPAGSLCSLKQQTDLIYIFSENKRHYFLPQDLAKAKPYIYQEEEQEEPLYKQIQFSEQPSKINISKLFALITECFPQLSEASFHFSELDIQPSSEIYQIRQAVEQKQDDPVLTLNSVLNQHPIWQQELENYAKTIANNAEANLTSKNAIMMLGLNRVPYWIIRRALEVNLFKIQHQNTHRFSKYLESAQAMAHELSSETEFIYPEEAKLIITFCYYPYLYNAQLALKSFPMELDSLSTEAVFGLKIETAISLSQTISKLWLDKSWINTLIDNQNLPIERVISSKQDRQSLAILKLSNLATHLIYSGQEISLDNSEIQMCLKSLKMTADMFQIKLINCIENNHFYSPRESGIKFTA